MTNSFEFRRRFRILSGLSGIIGVVLLVTSFAINTVDLRQTQRTKNSSHSDSRTMQRYFAQRGYRQLGRFLLWFLPSP